VRVNAARTLSSGGIGFATSSEHTCIAHPDLSPTNLFSLDLNKGEEERGKGGMKSKGGQGEEV
jgi:hypothetical protein